MGSYTSKALTYAESDRYTVTVLPSKNKLKCIDALSKEVREIKVGKRPSGVSIHNECAYVVHEAASYIYIVDLSKPDLLKTKLYFPQHNKLSVQIGALDILIVNYTAYILKDLKNGFYIYDLSTKKFVDNTLASDNARQLFLGQDPKTRVSFLYSFSQNRLTVYRLDTNTSKTLTFPNKIKVCVSIGTRLFLHYEKRNCLVCIEISFTKDDGLISLIEHSKKELPNSLLSLSTDGNNLFLVYAVKGFKKDYFLTFLDSSLCPHASHIKLEDCPLFIRHLENQTCLLIGLKIYVYNHNCLDFNTNTPIAFIDSFCPPSLPDQLIVNGLTFYDTAGERLGERTTDSITKATLIKQGLLGLFLSHRPWRLPCEPDCSPHINYETLSSDGMVDLVAMVSFSIPPDDEDLGIFAQYEYFHQCFLRSLASCNPYACALAAYTYFTHADFNFETGFSYYRIADKKTFAYLCLLLGKSKGE